MRLLTAKARPWIPSSPDLPRRDAERRTNAFREAVPPCIFGRAGESEGRSAIDGISILSATKMALFLDDLIDRSGMIHEIKCAVRSLAEARNLLDFPALGLQFNSVILEVGSFAVFFHK